MQERSQYADYLIDPRFQELNRLFLWFENNDDWTGHTENFLPRVGIKDYNDIINR